VEETRLKTSFIEVTVSSWAKITSSKLEQTYQVSWRKQGIQTLLDIGFKIFVCA
jgi:hypothetical protein